MTTFLGYAVLFLVAAGILVVIGVFIGRHYTRQEVKTDVTNKINQGVAVVGAVASTEAQKAHTTFAAWLKAEVEKL